MITIKLNPSVFTTKGAPFYGVDPKKAVFHIGEARNDLFLGKIIRDDASSVAYRGGQTVLLIDRIGTQFSNESFEYIMNNPDYVAAYGHPILRALQSNILVVEQDGTPMLASAVVGYTAP